MLALNGGSKVAISSSTRCAFVSQPSAEMTRMRFVCCMKRSRSRAGSIRMRRRISSQECAPSLRRSTDALINLIDRISLDVDTRGFARVGERLAVLRVALAGATQAA